MCDSLIKFLLNDSEIKDLNIRFDVYEAESEYFEKARDIVDLLLKNGVAKKLWVRDSKSIYWIRMRKKKYCESLFKFPEKIRPLNVG